MGFRLEKTDLLFLYIRKIIFIMIKLNENVRTTLRNYVIKNSLVHDQLIGKRVFDKKGEEWYINDIDPIHDTTKLPYQIFCGKRPESEFGKYINTDELYILDDVDLGVQPRVQSQSQPVTRVKPDVQIQESDQTVAKNILFQLGGNKFLTITGTKNLVSDLNSLSFRIPRSKDGINYIKITLTSKDIYDVEYGKIYGYKYTIVKREEGIYNNMLVSNFEKNTGLLTSI